MKKILLLAFCAVITGVANKSLAQSFTTPHDTVNATYTNSMIEVHNNITNTTASPIKVVWNIVPDSTNFPASWTLDNALGICDNATCRINTGNILTNGTAYTSVDYAPGVEGDFHLQLDLSTAVAGTYHLTVRLVNGTTVKYTTFIVNKFATSVGTTVKSADNINLYPNPARNFLNVTFNPDAGVKNIAVFNLIGKIVSNYKVSGSSAQLDINDIPSGVYYLRMFDGQGKVVATRRFTHQ